MATTVRTISKKKFGSKTWSLTRHFLQDIVWTQLSDGDFVDYPVRYHNGDVVYDRPEGVPKKVKDWVHNELGAYVKEHGQYALTTNKS